jgi:PAS domain S-box-containing protein
MDIRIKGEMDGIEAAEVIRNQFGIPVIFSTAYLDQERIERAKITMPFGYVLKPIQERDLKVTLEMALYVAEFDCERKKVAEALKESEAQKRAILNGISTNIAFVDENLEILWANETAAESVKKTPEEIIGKRCYELWADPEKICENCPTVKAFQTKKSEHTIMHTPDGRIWDEVGEPVFDSEGNVLGVVEIAQDITELKKVEESLKKSEKKYRDLVDLLPTGMFEIDESGILLFANRAFLTMFGCDKSDLNSNFDIFQLIAPEDREMAKSNSIKVKDGVRFGGSKYMAMNKSGTRFPITIHSSYIRSENRNTQMGVVIDISTSEQVEKMER